MGLPPGRRWSMPAMLSCEAEPARSYDAVERQEKVDEHRSADRI